MGLRARQLVILDATASTDPNHSTASLLIEWDLDDDGTFDTAPTNQKTAFAAFGAAGTRRVRCRLTDPAGAVTVSTPIAMRLDGTPCAADLDDSGDVGFADILDVVAAWGPCPAICREDLSGNGAVDFADILAVIAAWGPCGT